jgi:hypothetical protein
MCYSRGAAAAVLASRNFRQQQEATLAAKQAEAAAWAQADGPPIPQYETIVKIGRVEIASLERALLVRGARLRSQDHVWHRIDTGA